MPARAEWRSRAHLARILRECLREGASIEIDGLGTFLPDARRGFRFISRHRPKVFVAYAQEDAANADRLFLELAEAGFDPWLDRHKLLPGQNWPRSIEQAIQNSDFIVACFSRRSVTKKGGFQAEIRYALDCMRHGDRLLAVLVRGRCGPILPSAQQHKVFANHLGRVHLFSVLIVVAPRLKPAFHVHLLPFGQVVGHVLRPPVLHAMPVGLLFPFAGLLVLPAAGRR